MKNNSYFLHDSNAHNDAKCIQLRLECGWEGYGVFWALIERMRESTGSVIHESELPAIAYAFHLDTDVLQRYIVGITKCKLFVYDNGAYYSPRLLTNMARMEKRSVAARENVAKRWQKEPVGYNGNTTVIPTEYNGNTLDKIRLDKNRVRTRFTPPSLDECKELFKAKNYTNAETEAQKFFTYYESNGWKVGRNSMKKWDAAAANWNSRNSQNQKPQTAPAIRVPETDVDRQIKSVKGVLNKSGEGLLRVFLTKWRGWHLSPDSLVEYAVAFSRSSPQACAELLKSHSVEELPSIDEIRSAGLKVAK